MPKKKYLSLAEYAKLHGIDPSRIRHKIAAGNFPYAIKAGSYWIVPEDAPWVAVEQRRPGPGKKAAPR